MNNIMKAAFKSRLVIALIAVVFASQASISTAGEESEHKSKDHKHASKDKKHKSKDKESSKEDLMREISYMAKKLLDMSGEDSLTISSPSVIKPFIGVCSMVDPGGIKLTCITPESQADKNGLKTGDLVVSIDARSMVKSEQKNKHAYWDVVNSMEVGDVLKMDVMRGGEPMKIDVTVGSLSHPAYKCEINQ